MKKLFALVLTLVMVFAIAAPAMAAWGAPTAPTGSPFDVVVTKFVQKTAADGDTYYDAYPAGQAVVAGTKVFFQAVITVPTQAKIINQYGTPATAADFAAYIDLDNLSDVTVTASKQEYNANGTKSGTASTVSSFLDSDGNLAVAEPTADSLKTVYTALFTGTVKTTAAATAEIVVGYEAKLSAPASGIVKTVSGVQYTITTTGVVATPTNLGEVTLSFETLSDKTVGDWYLTYASSVYTVTAGPTFWKNDSGKMVKEPAGDTLNKLTAVYNGLVNLLGFKAGDTGIYYTSANIAATFGINGFDSDKAEYKPYTSSLTITDTTTVPNTGDSVSVIGFVMVGLALLATAAVVVKKVRA